jgi:hypothetical protein
VHPTWKPPPDSGHRTITLEARPHVPLCGSGNYGSSRLPHAVHSVKSRSTTCLHRGQWKITGSRPGTVGGGRSGHRPERGNGQTSRWYHLTDPSSRSVRLQRPGMHCQAASRSRGKPAHADVRATTGFDDRSGDLPIRARQTVATARPGHPMDSNQELHKFVACPSASGWTGPCAVTSAWPPAHVTRTVPLAGGPSQPSHPTRVRARPPGTNSTNPGGLNSNVTIVLAASASPSRPIGVNPACPTDGLHGRRHCSLRAHLSGAPTPPARTT